MSGASGGGGGGTHPLKSLRRQIDYENEVYEANYKLYDELNMEMPSEEQLKE